MGNQHMNIKKNGISIFVEGDEGKTPVIFVHGFPFDHRMWNNQVSKLSSNYFCITYDIRGLGDSDPGDGQYTIESFVDDLEMVVKEMVISSPVHLRIFNGRVYFIKGCRTAAE